MYSDCKSQTICYSHCTIYAIWLAGFIGWKWGNVPSAFDIRYIITFTCPTLKRAVYPVQAYVYANCMILCRIGLVALLIKFTDQFIHPFLIHRCMHTQVAVDMCQSCIDCCLSSSLHTVVIQPSWDNSLCVWHCHHITAVSQRKCVKLVGCCSLLLKCSVMCMVPLTQCGMHH